MEKLKKQLAVSFGIIFGAVLGCAVCAFFNLVVPIIFLGIVIAVCYANMRVFLQMYGAYRNMTSRMYNKGLEDFLAIIEESPYIWLSYASKKEIDCLRQRYSRMDSTHPKYNKVKYLVDWSYSLHR